MIKDLIVICNNALSSGTLWLSCSFGTAEPHVFHGLQNPVVRVFHLVTSQLYRPIFLYGICPTVRRISQPACTNPYPYMLSLPASPRSIALQARALRISCGVKDKFLLLINAATPLTNGAAIDVPLAFA